jgi:hypothetical protein
MPRTDRHREAPRAEAPRKRGRRIALTVYYAMVVLVGGTAAFQITRQVFFDPRPPVPYATCHQGLQALYHAVGRAREAAARSEGGEDDALARFRRALDPEWSYRDGVAAACQASARDAGTLDAIERLRYAEEHAVRREAGELAPLRRVVERQVQAIAGGEPGR